MTFQYRYTTQACLYSPQVVVWLSYDFPTSLLEPATLFVEPCGTPDPPTFPSEKSLRTVSNSWDEAFRKQKSQSAFGSPWAEDPPKLSADSCFQSPGLLQQLKKLVDFS